MFWQPRSAPLAFDLLTLLFGGAMPSAIEEPRAFWTYGLFGGRLRCRPFMDSFLCAGRRGFFAWRSFFRSSSRRPCLLLDLFVVGTEFPDFFGRGAGDHAHLLNVGFSELAFQPVLLRAAEVVQKIRQANGR